MVTKEIPSELRGLVNRSVALLGEVIRRELGRAGFQRIEKIRREMTGLRSVSEDKAAAHLRALERRLRSLSREDRDGIARAFTLMLELINCCENAYRSHRLGERTPAAAPDHLPDAIVYVLTAHPTEARSPRNIAAFHRVQGLLIQVLQRNPTGMSPELTAEEENEIRHALGICWRAPIVRDRAPRVKDEAEHIYSLLFRDDILFPLLEAQEGRVPVYLRSWVGGDKDGHPGVDERALLQSLGLSRAETVRVLLELFGSIRRTLALAPNARLLARIGRLERSLRGVRRLKAGDYGRVQALRRGIHEFKTEYEREIGALHPALRRMGRVFATFPALVVPLELRESSDVLMAEGSRGKLAISRMLAWIERLSRGGDPRWYARGFIISMTESIDHIRRAADFQRDAFGEVRLPVIPLFENAEALAQAESIVSDMTRDRSIVRSSKAHWGGLIEVMVGYSDSAKESGVLASRVAISEALPRIERVILRAGLRPVFFHGSGGSIDRGGGSIEDQTAWWPRSALRLYKVTVQGEMIERSLATPAIARRQIQKIVESASAGLSRRARVRRDPAVVAFAREVAGHYQSKVASPEFLRMVEEATPYPFLNVLKIGSRPSKRSAKLTVKGLRAIPWVLCWTQTRVLFPTWWGVGRAWKESTASRRKALRKAFRSDPVFTSYMKALGFTLAKVEMGVFRYALERSGLPRVQIERTWRDFTLELEAASECFREVCGQRDFLWFRPWLGESIYLRSAMIHPLNVLQGIAKAKRDVRLLRVTVAGISSGMLTTG